MLFFENTINNSFYIKHILNIYQFLYMYYMIYVLVNIQRQQFYLIPGLQFNFIVFTL